MKTYIETNNSIIFNNNNGSGMVVPKILANTDYQNILKEVQSGKAELIPFTPPTPTWEQIRQQRDGLLSQSDWAIIADATPKPNKEAWLNYRQALRDVPQNFSTPEAVVWPTKPS